MAIRLQQIAVASPFWYRRLSEISVLIGLLILAIFGFSNMNGAGIDVSMHIPASVAILAGITVICATLARLLGANNHSVGWGALTYGLLFTLSGWLVYATGGVLSPYVALWIVLVAGFGGMFGIWGIGLLALITNGFITWQFLLPPATATTEHFIVFAIATNLPIIIGYFMWHGRHQHEAHKDKAVTALTKQLTEVANKSEIVINSIADGVLAIDNQGTIQLINPAAQTLVGWGGADATGLNYESVLKLLDNHEQPLTPGKNPIEQVRVTKQPIVNNELTLTSKSGKKMLVSLVVSPVMEGKEVVAVIVVARDITSEKAREREQAEFISTASHEMRTPVASIEGYLGLALNPQTAGIDDKARMYLGKAQEAVQHLGRLFQDLLTVSRSEDGRLQNNPVATDMVAFMGSITEGLVPKATQKGLELRFAPTYDKPNDGEHTLTPIFYANIDRDHLREVANNLIENAIKYTREGKVIVNVTGDERRITISVSDSGIGIPHEDIPHLFQKFYRVDNSDTREIGGTGLGLYICRQLVEAMRGRIWVESELGKGSTFFVSFARISHLDIKNMQQSQAIEALQKTAEVTTPAPAPTPAAALVPQPAPVTSMDILSPPTPIAKTEPAITQKTPAPIPAAPLQAPAPAPQLAAPAPVVSDIQPPQNRGNLQRTRGSLAVPTRNRVK